MASCVKWGEQRTQECSDYRDEGSNQCSQWADQGSSQCCDWAPCSWFCDAFYWVAKWVCLGYYWVANIVCVAWTWVTTAICLAWDVITTVVSVIINTIESVVGWIASAIAFIVNLILSIPFIGRLINWIWNIILTIVWGIVGLVDTVLGVLGVMPEKKLRVTAIILRDEDGTPVETVAHVVAALQHAIDVYADQANVRIIADQAFQYTSGLGKKEGAHTDWVQTYPDSGTNTTNVLDVDCNAVAAGDDLRPTGSFFEYVSSLRDFYGNFRRLIGYGAPVTIFVVRSYVDPATTDGCSLGPLVNYVTVMKSDLPIGHELGHACNLWHVDDPENLMNPFTKGPKLTWWQVAILRNSRHVTYF